MLASKSVEETDWYSDEVMDLLFQHYVAQAHGAVSRVPAVLGSRNTLGINFLETFLSHHLLDHPQSRKPIVIPVNLGERHWVGLRIQFKTDGTVTVCYFDSINPQWLDAETDRAVRAALALAGFNQVTFVPEHGNRLQKDGYNCGPWVVEWLRAFLEQTSWQTLPGMRTARAEHRSVAGVNSALHRDREAGGKRRTDSGVQLDALQTLEALLQHDIWRRFILPGSLRSDRDSTLLDVGQQLVCSGELSLGLLYRRFLEHRGARKLAEQLFRARIAQLDQRYHATKAAILKVFGMEIDEKCERRPWDEKAPRLLKGQAPRRPYEDLSFKLYTKDLLQMGDLHCYDLPSDKVTLVILSDADKVDWMALAVLLIVIRKRFVRQWEKQKGSRSHITVVTLPSESSAAPCFWALNTKDKDGNGTTRILLPLCEETYEGEPQVRVLDLSYQQIADLTVGRSEVGSCLHGLIDALFPKAGQELGQTFLDLMSSSADVQRTCRRKLEAQTLSLERMHCVLLRAQGGVKLCTLNLASLRRDNLRLQIPIWNESLCTVHAPKMGPGAKILDRKFSALQLAYYFLGIVVAETRHARGVYVSTMDLFELIQQGFVQPTAIFSDLDGQIEHGWLLPGANFLSGTMSPELKRLAMPLVGAVVRNNTQIDEIPDVQRAVNGKLIERGWSDERSLEDPSHPVYQVLQKCLFITLLRFLARCPSDVGTLLCDVRDDWEPSNAWPPGYDIASPFIWSKMNVRADLKPPHVDDLGDILFGDQSDQCDELMERAKKMFEGTDLEIFCTLFKIAIKLFTRTGDSWHVTRISPSGGGARAEVSLVKYKDQGGIHGWKVLVPSAWRPSDYLAELRQIFGSPSDFEADLEKQDMEEEEYVDDEMDSDGSCRRERAPATPAGRARGRGR